MTLAGVNGQLDVEQHLRAVVWELQYKAYAAANTAFDTDFIQAGPVEPGFSISPADQMLEKVTGLPGVLKKTVAVERGGSVKCDLHNTEDALVEMKISGDAMAETFGLETTINDAGAVATDFDLTSVAGLAVGDYMQYTHSDGNLYYFSVGAISGVNVTCTPDLPVTPGNGQAVKQILRTDHSINLITKSYKSFRFVGTDQNGEQLVRFIPKARTSLNGPLLNFGDGSNWVSLPLEFEIMGDSAAIQGGSEVITIEDYHLSGDYKLTTTTLSGASQELNNVKSCNVAITEIYWKEQTDAAAYNDADWKKIGAVAPGSVSESFNVGMIDYKSGLPKAIKASVPISVSAEVSAELDEIGHRSLELAAAGNRMEIVWPCTVDTAVNSGSSTTKIILTTASAPNFTDDKLVSVYRAAAAAWEVRTIDSIATGDPSITVTVALGDTPADNDIVRHGVWQAVAASPSPSTTVFALDSASLFSAGNHIIVRDATNATTAATSSVNDQTHLVLSSATGYAAGTYIEVQDLSTNKVEYTRISSLAGTVATLDPGLTFTPANGDIVGIVDFGVIQSISSSTLTLVNALSFTPADNDIVGRIDAIGVKRGGSDTRVISLRIVRTNEDASKQFVTVVPKFQLDPGSQLNHPDLSKFMSASLKGKAIALSQTFDGSTVWEAARFHILRGSSKISA